MTTTTAECTVLDHSDYKKATNFWGLDRIRRCDTCAKCGRVEFTWWFQRLEWTNTDPVYWKKVFKDATEQKVFFFKAEGFGSYRGAQTISVDADIDDPASILRPTRPLWLKTDVSVAIKQERYQRRRLRSKEHNYGRYQPSIDREIARMVEGLDYVDNRRFAALDSRKDMRRYNEWKDSGCCGSHDEVVTIYGRRFTIGCNHGH